MYKRLRQKDTCADGREGEGLEVLGISQFENCQNCFEPFSGVIIFRKCHVNNLKLEISTACHGHSTCQSFNIFSQVNLLRIASEVNISHLSVHYNSCKVLINFFQILNVQSTKLDIGNSNFQIILTSNISKNQRYSIQVKRDQVKAYVSSSEPLCLSSVSICLPPA